MSSRLPLTTSGVENVHVHQTESNRDVNIKSKGKYADEAGTRLEKEVSR